MVFFSSLFLKTLRLLSLKFKPVGIFFYWKNQTDGHSLCFFFKKEKQKEVGEFFFGGFYCDQWVALGFTGLYRVLLGFYCFLHG